MILLSLLLWLPAAGLLSWLAGRRNPGASRWVALVALGLHLAAVAGIWAWSPGGTWMLEYDRPWIPQLGIRLHLGLDGLSLALLLLTDLLGLLAVAASWSGIEERVGFFHMNLLWTLSAIAGVFLALDLVLFYLFWEMMLIPLYFLIGIWGHENRTYATLKFFLFTQASSLFMLLSILGLYFAHGADTGVYTFDYSMLLGTSLSPGLALALMLGFFLAFAVKLPAVPLHTWLPDAHTQAPTAGSVLLAGLVLKAGAYGLLRFVGPLFPQAALDFAPLAMVLGVVGILYGAFQAFGQTDLKRLVAYTSVSHMGFVLLGVFAWNRLALQGVLVVMVAHGVSTGALFILAGDLYHRLRSREMAHMGGFWAAAPRMGGVGLLFALASLGLPGLGNFVGEFLVLLGVYQVSVPLAVLASLGLVVSAIYSLRLVQRVFLGPPPEDQAALPDYGPREMAIMAVLIVAIIALGLYPQPLLNLTRPPLETLQRYVVPAEHAAAPAGAALPAPDWRPAGPWDAPLDVKGDEP